MYHMIYLDTDCESFFLIQDKSSQQHQLSPFIDSFHVTAPVGLVQRSHDQQYSLTPRLPGKKTRFFYPSSISRFSFLVPPSHFVMTAIAMTTTLKVKEVDLSPSDAEATPTQVCRTCLYPACFANSWENNVEIINNDITLLRTSVKMDLDIEWNWFYGVVEHTCSKPNLSLLSP